MRVGRVGKAGEEESCPLALKFSFAENKGEGGAKGKERVLGTLYMRNRRESDPGLPIQGPGGGYKFALLRICPPQLFSRMQKLERR